MSRHQQRPIIRRSIAMSAVVVFAAAGFLVACAARADAPLPPGARVVWDIETAQRETTPTRERIVINGLWRWQPAEPDDQRVPDGRWGYFKVPGCWPGITDYMQKDCQTVHADPSWRDFEPGKIRAAWYQRAVTIPAEWAGRRVALRAEYVNSLAVVYVDGKQLGELRFPGGEMDITAACQPGARHMLSLLVVAMPLRGVMLSYSDSNSARQVAGSVARRGLCGDVFLIASPAGPRLEDVTVDTSVREGTITLGATVEGIEATSRAKLRAAVYDGERKVLEFAGEQPVVPSDLAEGRVALATRWKPEKLWDLHTPEHQYELRAALLDAEGRLLDAAFPARFGFREFWIDGRDFFLNGTRVYLCAVPLDNAQVGAAWASYDGAKESLRRLRGFGINAVYTHNYDCEPGSHLSFSEILRAADDVGMLVAFSQPHFAHYDWTRDDAERTNGYARHAAFYVGAARNHPSVVMYAMSHNATGYSEDMNPDRIDGIDESRDEWSARNAQRARRAEAVVRRFDASRVIYHHSSGNLGSMHTSNFYPNWVPIQEMSDWFEHWATQGVKPFFTCEYGAPFTWDWAMYRGWYRGAREFGSAAVPWDFCLAEWNAQFLGEAAYRISRQEAANLRWEAARFREGQLWHRWDYPHQLGSTDFDERYPILAAYLTDNWRAFRTWGVSAISPWEHGVYWKLRPGMERNRRVELPTDWEKLQRVGFSPDYLAERYERMDLAYETTDWLATPAAEAMNRNNGPLLAYIAGGDPHFTAKDHNFLPGETVEKQIIVINNSRETVAADCTWSFALPRPVGGAARIEVPTGQQRRIPLRCALPDDLPPGRYPIEASIRFEPGDTQKDRFDIDVLPLPAANPSPVPKPPASANATSGAPNATRDATPNASQPAGPSGAGVALFDPKGETTRLLGALGVACRTVDAGADMSGVDVLVIGKGAITPDGALPDLARVRDGLRVIVFEQTAEALEQRLGLRVAEYGLRMVFPRLPDHPDLAGVEPRHLRDWRGEATLLPPRLDYQPSDKYAGAPVVRWCGLEVPRLWRCGNRGNVASVLIEKPSIGDWLPILDGGFSLQYSPLLEYREGKGMILFCQMDVTGRTAADPAAMRLARNMLARVIAGAPAGPPPRTVLYVGDSQALRWLQRAGVHPQAYAGGAPNADQVLIAGAGAAETLAPHARALAEWLRAGGHLVALETDAGAAGRFLPFPIETQPREHIAAWFEPPGLGSPFAGIAPADVHNRDPRTLPLLSGGLRTLAGGVLGASDDGRVVFCQLAPYRFVTVPDDVPGLVPCEDDAVEGRRSATVTLGTIPWAQVGQKLAAGLPGKTYVFSASVKALGRPARARLEVERAGRPWDRAARGDDVELPADRWTELRVAFTVDKPYPEGWQAYVHCGEPETRLRLDAFRLRRQPDQPRRDGAPATADSPDENLLANPGFEEGIAPWFFNWKTEQQNLRRTFRRSSFLLSRLLGNLGVRAETPLVGRFASPVGSRAAPSILRNGDFVAAPGDAIPEPWQFTSDGRQAACTIETDGTPDARRCVRIDAPDSDSPGRGNVMLAQHEVAVEQGQWYRVALRARSEGLDGTKVNLALQETTAWRPLFDYQRFATGRTWKQYVFFVQAVATARSKTRFQIWHGGSGTLWIADVSMSPCAPPNEGRWLEGLYVDRPQEWDDPYRFFRW